MDRQPIVLHVPQSKTKTSNLIQYLFFLFRKKKNIIQSTTMYYENIVCILLLYEKVGRSSVPSRIHQHSCVLDVAI